jgi:hypothetical protein
MGTIDETAVPFVLCFFHLISFYSDSPYNTLVHVLRTIRHEIVLLVDISPSAEAKQCVSRNQEHSSLATDYLVPRARLIVRKGRLDVNAASRMKRIRVS